MSKFNYNVFLVFLIIPVSALQYYMVLSSGPLDILMLLFFLKIVTLFFRGALRLDKISILYIFTVFLGISTFFIFHITEFSWLNIFRSNLYACIVYVYIINLRGRFSLSSYVLILTAINLCLLWLIFDFWRGGFSHYSLDSSYFNLNNIGFLSLMIFLSAIAIYQKIEVSNFIVLTCISSSLIVIFLSFSRANYLLLFISLLILAFKVFKGRNRLFFFAFLLSTAPLLIYLSDNEKISSGLKFLEAKAKAGTPLEMFLSRWDFIIFQPLIEYFENRNMLEMFFGGSVLPEHSLALTFFTCFGFISFSVYLYLNALMFRGLFTKNTLKVASSLMILVLFINDASTNASSYVLLIKFVPIITYGLLVGVGNEKYRVKF